MAASSGLNFSGVAGVSQEALNEIRLKKKQERDRQLAEALVECETRAQGNIDAVVAFLKRIRAVEKSLSGLLKDCRSGNVDAFTYQDKINEVLRNDRTGMMHRQIPVLCLPYSKEHFES